MYAVYRCFSYADTIRSFRKTGTVVCVTFTTLSGFFSEIRHLKSTMFVSFCYLKQKQQQQKKTPVTTILDPEFFGTRVGCHVSAVEWV